MFWLVYALVGSSENTYLYQVCFSSCFCVFSVWFFFSLLFSVMQGLNPTTADPNAAGNVPGATPAAPAEATTGTAKAAGAPPTDPQGVAYSTAPVVPVQLVQGASAQTPARTSGTLQQQDIASGLVAEAIAAGHIDISKVTNLKQGTSLIVSEVFNLDEQALDLASLNQLCSFNLDATIKIFEEIENLAVELKMGQSAPKLTGFHMIQDLRNASSDEQAVAACMLGYGIKPKASFPNL